MYNLMVYLFQFCAILSLSMLALVLVVAILSLVSEVIEVIKTVRHETKLKYYRMKDKEK